MFTIKTQSFTRIHSQTNTRSFSDCDYPVCWQTSLGSLRPALLEHFSTVVQKGLSMPCTSPVKPFTLPRSPVWTVCKHLLQFTTPGCKRAATCCSKSSACHARQKLVAQHPHFSVTRSQHLHKCKPAVKCSSQSLACHQPRCSIWSYWQLVQHQSGL